MLNALSGQNDKLATAVAAVGPRIPAHPMLGLLHSHVIRPTRRPATFSYRRASADHVACLFLQTL